MQLAVTGHGVRKKKSSGIAAAALALFRRT